MDCYYERVKNSGFYCYYASNTLHQMHVLSTMSRRIFHFWSGVLTRFIHSKVRVSIAFAFDIDIQHSKGPCLQKQLRMESQSLLSVSKYYCLITKEGGLQNVATLAGRSKFKYISIYRVHGRC